MSEELADNLARRAGAVFAHQPFWARKASPRAGARKVAAHAGARQQFECRRQREFILMSMRHWLAGVLARERPALFRALPESFKIGLELPEMMDLVPTTLNRPLGTFSRSHGRRMLPRPGPLPRAERVNHRLRFVHGCKLLPA